MKLLIRKTLTGNEYWDTEAKKTVFVLNGEEPNFEAKVNEPNIVGENEANIDLDDMNADELRLFAEQNGIEVPGNMKKEDTIRNYIGEQLTADQE